MTFRSFISRCSDLIRYRRATRDMDAQYPNATEEDVGRLGDRVCIICREEMVVSTAGGGRPGEGDRERERGGEAEVPLEPPTEATPPAQEGGPNETPKKLICGHVFHFHCLRSWLERQQSCPTWYVPSHRVQICPLTDSRRDVLHTPAPTRTRRAAPPAPGAVPQVPVPAREQFNEFFRLPNENGVIPPAPGPTGEPTHGPTPTVPTQTQLGEQPTTNTPEPTLPNDEDVRIQTSIWGGPIQPGRFFATRSYSPLRPAFYFIFVTSSTGPATAPRPRSS
jgi:E3 ubiquitin-protein ligase synoviolin